MHSIYVDAEFTDDERRAKLYEGDLFVYSPRPSTLALTEFAAEMARAAFAPLDPETAQFHMAVEDYAALLAELKPRFIHHPESKRLIQEMLVDFGCDPEQVYFDVPRMRSSTSDEYLTTGIAFAFHPHRDTWYSAPYTQLNWWLPIFAISEDNGLAFHPKYWHTPVQNSSRVYNYAEWNATSRKIAATQIGVDTRIQPKPEEEVELMPQIRPIVKPGGIILFSGAQLHSSVPNTSGRTRFSIDLRTVHLGDTESGWAAPNIDSECTGTTMGDYLRVSDLEHIPSEVVEAHDTPRPASEPV
ncbi:phytanoyl-CoA dioxygenase family protein [Kribbella sp. NPDC026611]|uniref:phytanoyl-CoA dioxygenase family protein n=1 Tax=Kribbella sp. NPDC026611 TaxID=3154911 RepID=UPI0033C54454